VVTARNLRAQDPMAKWKPSVGDKFVYFQTWEDGTYWHGAPYSVSSGTDTLTMEILSTDSAYNATYEHVVTVWNSSVQRKTSYKTFYYYHPGQNLNSTHPLAIDLGDTLCTNCITTGYDFSIARDTQVTYGSNPLTVYAFEHDSEINGNQNAFSRTAAQYSPAFKWFYSESSSDYEPQGPYYYYGSFGSSTLISATTVHTGVDEQPAQKYAPMTIVQSAQGKVIRAFFRPLHTASSLEVFDLLARKQLVIPITPGISTIDFPGNSLSPGCYFARLGNAVAKFAVLK
jgi:hypothetical protein